MRGFLILFLAASSVSAKRYVTYRGCRLALKEIYGAAPEDYVRARIRELGAHDDFKVLTDMVPKKLSQQKIAALVSEAVAARGATNEKAVLHDVLLKLFAVEDGLERSDPSVLGPRQMLAPAPGAIATDLRQQVVGYIEETWGELLRRTKNTSKNSLLPVPNPILIAGERFKEGYYWDSYFGMLGMLVTGRHAVARMQIDNFLFLLKAYGRIPNGLRTYYLSRSQPPVISMMIVEYLRALAPEFVRERQSLLRESLPLLAKDYRDFWMNKDTRYDEARGLNHHWDDLDTEREERHGTDNDLVLGATYRDTRAEAESGKDFTDEFGGRATEYDSVLLNSLMYKYELNLAELYRQAENTTEAARYAGLAEKRRDRFNEFLWDEARGNYFSYNYKTGERSSVLTADVFAVLEAGLVPAARLQRFLATAGTLVKKGGVVASDVNSGKQWDGPYAWAPHQYFAIEGLRNLATSTHDPRLSARVDALARKVATNWTSAIERIFSDHKVIYEKHDAMTGDLPPETGDKYPNQRGFLWNNATYLWILKTVFGRRFVPVP